MRARLVHLAQNLLLSALTLLACFAVLELVVFRYVLPPDDVLRNVTINGVVRYEPGSRATFRHPDGSATQVRINSHGWNATRDRYDPKPAPGILRVAVVGDSYVHGAFIDTADGFPEVLERQLVASGREAEVLRFGMDGAPLSQYLHMLRKEVVRYRPDVVVVPLIHNDFDESWRFLKTRYASSFLKVDVDAPDAPREVAPSDFEPGAAAILRTWATFRYLYYETNAYLHLKSLVSRYVWGGNETWSREHIQSAVDIRKIADHARNRRAARYVMGEMKALAEKEGFRLLFVMDGVREAVYAGKPQQAFAVGRLNALAADVTRELGLPFVDLFDTFRDDYARHGERFEFAFDWHWNRHANRLVGETIARILVSDPRLVPARSANAAARATPAGG